VQIKPPAVALLLLNSAADRLVQASCSQAIAQAWHCPLQTHPSAGHDLCLDAGEWVIEQITTQFFKKLE
jgi:predicted alpha/beta hydrolase family esterase